MKGLTKKEIVQEKCVKEKEQVKENDAVKQGTK